jgi:hypothetical protein
MYLDRTARALLAEGRANYRRFGLHDSVIVQVHDGESQLILWRGDRIVSTVAVALTAHGLLTSQKGMILTVDCDAVTLARVIRSQVKAGPPAPEELARKVANKVVQKWDHVLDDDLLDLVCARRDLDVDGAWHAFAELADAI